MAITADPAIIHCASRSVSVLRQASRFSAFSVASLTLAPTTPASDRPGFAVGQQVRLHSLRAKGDREDLAQAQQHERRVPRVRTADVGDVAPRGRPDAFLLSMPRLRGLARPRPAAATAGGFGAAPGRAGAPVTAEPSSKSYGPAGAAPYDRAQWEARPRGSCISCGSVGMSICQRRVPDRLRAIGRLASEAPGPARGARLAH
jgi:hypothetical protein